MIDLTPEERALVTEAEEIDTTVTVEEILKTSQISWEKQLTSEDIDAWLSNFHGDALGSSKAEQNLALWLLSGFTYFSLDDIRWYCQYLFTEFLHHKLVEYQQAGLFQDLSIKKQVEHILDSTVFLTLGNDSESGSNVLYYFRQINHLEKRIFEKQLDQLYENLVFVDDITVSGIQALTYIPQIRSSIKTENTYYLTFLASDTAIDALIHIGVKTIYGNGLSDREKCFSSDSYVFSSERRKRFLPVAAKMCEHYGSKITEGHPEVAGYPFGFDQTQSLFCFFYNTPDNTLPIFWCEGKGWNPIFKRYEKRIDRGEVILSDSRYV